MIRQCIAGMDDKSTTNDDHHLPINRYRYDETPNDNEEERHDSLEVDDIASEWFNTELKESPRRKESINMKKLSMT